MKSAYWLAPAVLVVCSVGCGKSTVAEPEAKPASTNPAVVQESTGSGKTPADADSYLQERVVNTPAAVLPVDVDSTPEQVVTEFLNAMKTGNDGVASGLLTSTAREETARHNLAVQPPGSPTAAYEVTASEISEDDPNVAQVGCLWTEASTEGTEQSEQVVWVLRKHSEGWRVFGMATQMPTRQEPVFFNFEDPAEMTALMDEIYAEMAAAQAAENPAGEEGEGIRGAAKPGDEENSLR